MGGKTETVSGVGTAKMFPEELNINLYMDNIVRAVAFYKTSDPAVLLPTLLDIKKNFNVKLLEKLDITEMAQSDAYKSDNALILQKVQSIDPDAEIITAVNRYAISDDQVVEAHLYETYGLAEYTNCGYLEWLIGGKRLRYQEITSTLQPSGDYIYDVNMYECQDDGSGGYAYVFDSTINFPHVDDNVVWVHYTRYGETTDRLVKVFESGTMSKQLTDNLFMIMNYRVNGVDTDDKYKKIINTIMGLSDGTLDSALSDKDIKSFFLTYSSQWTYDEDMWQSQYGHLIEDMMNWSVPEDSGYDVYWVHDGVAMSVRYVRKPRTDGTDGIAMYINGVEYVNDNNPPIQYMLPVEFFQKRIMVDQYKDLAILLTFFAYVEKEVKLKWYQTWIFRAILWIVAVVLAIYGMPAMLIGMLSAEVVKRLPISDKTKMILNVALSIITMNPSAIMANIFTAVSFVLNIASQLLTFYFKSMLEGFKEELKELDDKTKEVAKAIAEISRKGIYFPLDAIGEIYDNIYELPYKAVDAMYNYDDKIEVDVLTDYEYRPEPALI